MGSPYIFLRKRDSLAAPDAEEVCSNGAFDEEINPLACKTDVNSPWMLQQHYQQCEIRNRLACKHSKSRQCTQLSGRNHNRDRITRRPLFRPGESLTAGRGSTGMTAGTTAGRSYGRSLGVKYASQVL